jgi:CARDB
VKKTFFVLVFLAALDQRCSLRSFDTRPDLQITNLSVYSTLVQTDGSRLVVASFRVVNGGNAPAAATYALVKMSTTAAAFLVPGLQPGEAAFLSQSVRTNLGQVTIQITADAGQALAESNENNNAVGYIAHLDQVEFGRWQSIGPTRVKGASGGTEGVGRVTTMALDPRSVDKLFVGARGSGLWMTSDGGQTWTPVTDSLPSTQIDAVALDPANSDRVLVATPAGVFQSTDGGSVWVQINGSNLQGLGSDGGAMIVGSVNTPLYLSTQNGVVVSADGGHTWNPVLTGGPVNSLQRSTTDPSHLFAAVSGSAPAVYEAFAGGLTTGAWHKQQGCPGAPLPAIPAGSQVWIAESHGTKWVSIKSPAGVALWRSTGKTCRILSGQQDSWEQLTLTNCNTGSDSWSFLFAHPADSAVLFKAGIGFCRSGDGGNTMTRIGPLHADQHVIAASVGNPAVMYEGDDGGLFRSDDKGLTWRFVGEGLAVTELLDVDQGGVAPRVFLGGAQDNAFFSWDGQSPEWTVIECPNPPDCGDTALVAFDRADKSVSFQVGQSTEHLNSYKDGGSESAIGSPGLVCLAYDEKPIVWRSMVSTGTSPPLVITCNGLWQGPPWTQVLGQGRSEDFSRAKLSRDGVWLAGTDAGKVFGGMSLASLSQLFASPSSKATSALAPADAKTFYVGLTDRSGASESGNRIFRLDCQLAGTPHCTNQEISAGLATGEVMAIASDPLYTDTLLVALRGKGIFRGTRGWLVALPVSAQGVAGQPAAAPGSPTSQPARSLAAPSTAPTAPPATMPRISPHLQTIFNTYRWSPYNNGLPAGVTATAIQVDGMGHFALATYGRGAFALSSGFAPSSTGSVTGYVTFFDEERLRDGPPGASNPLIDTVEIDALPGWIFSAANLGAPARLLKTAYTKHLRVVLDYKVASAQSGTITGAHLAN